VLLRLSMLCLLVLSCLSPLLAVKPCPEGVHPLVLASNGILFGGCINGKWMDPEQIVPKMKDGLTYRLYSATHYLGEVKGSKASLGDKDDRIQIPSVELEPLPKAAQKLNEPIIGICGTWDAQPRKPHEQKTDQPIYRQVVHDYLTAKGHPNAPVYISHIQRIDLEGDGTDEVLIYASSSPDADGWPEILDGYSVVLLRKIINGKVKTIPVDEFFANKSNGTRRILPAAILDVNGDGVLEVLLHSEEMPCSDGIAIYQVDGQVNGATMKPVLWEYVGD